VLNGILQAYIKTAWTLTYLRLTGENEILPELDILTLEDEGGVETEGED
jgi:hypothetical protein